MKRILVTGGAGFIGSNIAGALADEGKYRVVVCDHFGNTDKWRNLAKHRVFETITPVDVFYWLEAHADNLAGVIHMGAISSTTETDVDLILETNFSLSRLLWNWCSDHNAPFIYASSAAVYGGGEKGFDDDISSDYLTKLVPLNAYGWSKQLFDQFVSTMVESGDRKPPQWVGLRFFNVYGPNEYHKGEQKSVAAQIFGHAQVGRPVHLFRSHRPDYKDGGQMRDFIYVKDCVKVVKWFLENPGASGLFNLGTGKARSFEDLAKSMFNSVGKPPALTFFDMPENIKNKYQYFTEAKMDRLRAVGYKDAFTSLEDGISDYVKSHLALDDPHF